MPFQRFLRPAVAALAILAAASAGLASHSSSGTVRYTVVAGDSLWSIATARGLTVDELAAANGMRPGDVLLIGRSLVIPAGATGTGGRLGTPAPADPWRFCATFRPSRGPRGVLPAGLAGSARYYRLRPLFVEWARHYGVSLPLLEAIAWQESGWQQSLVSPTGAVGVGQIEPYTATFVQSYLVGQPLDIDSAADNIRMSAAFLAYLSRLEGGAACPTVAAYYEGPLQLSSVGVLPDAQQYVADVEYLESRFQ